jgi:hypothetical protein
MRDEEGGGIEIISEKLDDSERNIYICTNKSLKQWKN